MDSAVVFDFGTSSGRCMVVASDGSVLSRSSAVWPKSMFDMDPQHRTHHFDPIQAWQLLASCCRKALEGLDGDLVQGIRAVTATSQRHGCVLLDSSGQEIAGMTNADESSTPAWEETANANADDILRITGRWPQRFFLPAHLSWLKLHRPKLYQSIHRIVGIQDWMIYRLCRQVTSEPTIAADLMLFDLWEGKWSSRLLDLFEIEPGWLPPLYRSGSLVGMLTQTAADETGPRAGLPVIVGGADTQMGAVGLGCTNPNDVSIIMGSTAPLQMIVARPDLGMNARFWLNPSTLPGKWVAESNAGDAGSLISRFLDVDSGQSEQDDQPPDLPGSISIGACDRMVEARCRLPGSALASLGPTIFHGRDWLERTSIVTGLQNSPGSPSIVMQLYLAIVENIAFAIRANLDGLESLRDGARGRVAIGGGMVRSSLLRRILVNTINQPVIIPNEKEATSLGAAICALAGAGVFDTVEQAMEAMCAGSTVSPDAGLAGEYQERYSQWVRLCSLSI